jgi:hypothetical protein
MAAVWKHQGCRMHPLSCLANLRPITVSVRGCTFAVPLEVRNE